MSSNIKILFILSIVFVVFSCSTNNLKADSKNSSETRSSIITGDANEYQIEYLDEEIDLIKDNIQSNKNYDNLIFFVHGRGRHPEKALTQILPNLENSYTAAVIMFHWYPSYAGPIGYPDEHAIDSASSFNDAILSLAKYIKENPDFKALRPVLLIHSMGNIVFKTYIEKYYDNSNNDLKNIFSNIILNASDVQAEGHNKWLNKVNLSENIFVTINNNDKVLKASGLKNLQKRLGKRIKDKVQLSSNPRVKYLNFDNTGVNHRYYLPEGQNNIKSLNKFYNIVLNGNVVDLESIIGVKKKGEFYYFN